MTLLLCSHVRYVCNVCVETMILGPVLVCVSEHYCIIFPQYPILTYLPFTLLFSYVVISSLMKCAITSFELNIMTPNDW